MSRDKYRHKEIREKILEEISKKGLREPWCSHSGGKSIDFVAEIDDKTVHLSEPDIVVFEGDRTLIIEIELDDKPKDLFGVAFANGVSSRGRRGASEFTEIGRKSLLIVLDGIKNKSIDDRSNKKAQRDLLKSEIENKLDYQWLDIVLDNEASNAIDAWLDLKK
jgi:hypothetical protein